MSYTSWEQTISYLCFWSISYFDVVCGQNILLLEKVNWEIIYIYMVQAWGPELLVN